MKRFLFIFLSMMIVIGVCSVCSICINNESDALIGIKDITINEITDDIHLDYWFEDYKWSDDLRNQVNNNRSEYFWVVISYLIKNNSKKYTMNRVQFIPQYQGEMKKILVAYTIENNIFTYVQPEQEGGFAQRLLVKKMGHSAEEIENYIKKQRVKVKYSGNKKHTFLIQNAIDIYSKNFETQ